MLHKLIASPAHLITSESQLLALPFVDFLCTVSIAYTDGLFDEQELDTYAYKNILEESLEHWRFDRLSKAYILLVLEQALSDDAELKDYLLGLHGDTLKKEGARNILMIGFFTMILSAMPAIKESPEAPQVLKVINMARDLHEKAQGTNGPSQG